MALLLKTIPALNKSSKEYQPAGLSQASSPSLETNPVGEPLFLHDVSYMFDGVVFGLPVKPIGQSEIKASFHDTSEATEISLPRVDVEGGGFIELVDSMGSDISVVNAAKVSYARSAKSLNEKEEKLLNFLWNNHHTSPFRHCFLSFRVRCPIFVLRQWQKHEVGCAWKFDMNEQSARYSKLEHGYFRPETWRIQDIKNKQSSHGSLSPEDSAKADALLAGAYDVIDFAYNELLSMGVAREQARVILPVSTYTEFIWTGSLQAIMHFLSLRAKKETQLETRLYAEGIAKLTAEKFPKSTELILASLDWVEKA